MTSLSEARTKTRNELPTRIKNILPPSEYLEHRYRQSNQAIADGSAALLKAQLKAGHHTLTPESWKAVVRKYDWQFCLQPTLF
jgi:hypothetical protein